MIQHYILVSVTLSIYVYHGTVYLPSKWYDDFYYKQHKVLTMLSTEIPEADTGWYFWISREIFVASNYVGTLLQKLLPLHAFRPPRCGVPCAWLGDGRDGGTWLLEKCILGQTLAAVCSNGYNSVTRSIWTITATVCRFLCNVHYYYWVVNTLGLSSHPLFSAEPQALQFDPVVVYISGGLL